MSWHMILLRLRFELRFGEMIARPGRERALALDAGMRGGEDGREP